MTFSTLPKKKSGIEVLRNNSGPMFVRKMNGFLIK